MGSGPQRELLFVCLGQPPTWGGWAASGGAETHRQVPLHRPGRLRHHQPDGIAAPPSVVLLKMHLQSTATPSLGRGLRSRPSNTAGSHTGHRGAALRAVAWVAAGGPSPPPSVGVEGGWTEPGRGGRRAAPVGRAQSPWHRCRPWLAEAPPPMVTRVQTQGQVGGRTPPSLLWERGMH